MKQLFSLFIIAGLFSSCAATFAPASTESQAIREETRELLRAKVDKMAGVTQDNMTFYLVLNENNSFAAIVNMNKTKQYDFCAGTYRNHEDTLTLNYYKNYMSKYLTDRAVIDNDNKQITFIDANGNKGRVIKFLTEKVY
ncbi:hypothetical protein [Ferruginibacter albus]|uniref:hypothetical protein n=1 Tax=Ferruginibacter albus TaxID=2875540 RepID=UPI001CC7A974|nr:hypothetical protein [Ferruginibacter albus]UAY52993.1 hypothetical protein K9M53_04770 [Ferruginibacter albus]